MFLKSYVQLCSSDIEPTVRICVFSYDRPCYPEFDKAEELILHHFNGNIDEEIAPVIHLDNSSQISHFVMDILCSMSSEPIPEGLGHNYPLFLAYKKAKHTLNIYLQKHLKLPIANLISRLYLKKSSETLENKWTAQEIVEFKTSCYLSFIKWWTGRE